MIWDRPDNNKVEMVRRFAFLPVDCAGLKVAWLQFYWQVRKPWDGRNYIRYGRFVEKEDAEKMRALVQRQIDSGYYNE